MSDREKKDFILALKRMPLTSHERKTLRGQALTGDIDEAKKGLETIKKKRPAEFYFKCDCCYKLVERYAPGQGRGRSRKYCPECADIMKDAGQKKRNEQRIDQRHADATMAAISTGKLDERLKECRRRGISYGQLQKELTLEKVRRGEL